MRIRAAGFNGIAAITWAADYLQKMSGKLSVGLQLNGTSPRLEKTVSGAIGTAGHGKNRLFSIGLMTAGKCE